MIKIEVCSNSLPSCLAAQNGGASRIELCSNLQIGGTTPAYTEIINARKILNIELNILIRPRAGNFIYHESEIEQMKEDIQFCGGNGCNGIVFGILTKNREIDVARNKILLDCVHSYGMSATFHRAFDYCMNLNAELEKIIKLGFDRILTSGGKGTAMEGIEKITELIKTANQRIIIMPGGGINENNISEIIKISNAQEIHGSFSNKGESNSRETDQKIVENSIKRANQVRN